MKAKLTPSKVDSLRPEPKGSPVRYEVCDTITRGLSVRVAPDGAKTYTYRFRRPPSKQLSPTGERVFIPGEQVRITLGDAYAIPLGDERSLSNDDARGKANQIRAMLAEGRDPIAEKEAEKEAEEERAKLEDSNTFGRFVEGDYRSKHLANRKTGDETLQRLKACFKEDFWDVPLSAITAVVVDGWVARRVADGRANATINRDVICLRGVFTKAVKWNRIETHPLHRKVDYLDEDRDQEARVLTPAEEKSLMEALDKRQDKQRENRRRHNVWRAGRDYDLWPNLDTVTYTDPLKPMAELSLQTGLRRNETYSLEWGDVDFEKRRLTVRGTVAKSGSTRYVPLNDEALRILATWRNEGGHAGLTKETGFVFPSPRGGGKIDNMQKSWEQVRTTAGLKDFVWHNLRSTAASRLVNGGSNLLAVMRILGHQSIKTTQQYLKSDEQLQIDAMNRLMRPANVVLFTPKQDSEGQAQEGRA